ncbi:L-threonylcarbamoyladenylate synthase [Salirhabdus euzebyi]|uniref:Threonylcarbamoyl-AMP synthase n=1 Tax=Salirhabdus euzebyi TaxID=394506 RepID=A0A841Q6I1_9BACI|nr:L-threonylcarbamoyladenylate synthase [Salirhabdus euzebyi]MBB6453937.1 L-threonylcarbamoyladenylate synthase [Salirhabdus euzebyi]
MQTKYWNVNELHIDENYPAIKEAAEVLKNKEAVAFPTETVYGLGADATSEEAVDKIFQAKGRPADNPLIVHIGDVTQVKELTTEIPEVAKKLMDKFFPGALTVILESNGACAHNVTAGLSTVGIRMPDHPVAIALLKACNLPVAAPSANRSGRPSPTTAKHVKDDLEGRIFGILDGGPTGIGLESTVVDCTGEIPVILRPGGVTKEELEEIVGTILVDPALLDKEEKPKSPGMKYTHYAPNAPLWVINGDPKKIEQQIKSLQHEGKKVGVMGSEECIHELKGVITKSYGSKNDVKDIARRIYDVLRSFNEEDVDIILAEAVPKNGVGVAVMNRLEKAASKILITES